MSAKVARFGPRRLLLVLAGGLIGGLGVAVADDGTNTVRGKQLYYDHACYGCHGYNGLTGARDLVGSPIVANDQAFMVFLRARGDMAPLLPTAQMPSYPASTLSDAEARDILTYIRTFEPDAPNAAEVPTLKTILELANRSQRPKPDKN